MADKTIKLSEDAIEALTKLKREGETFSDVIFRLIGIRRKKEEFLAWIESLEPNEELASAIEEVYKNRENWTFRTSE